MRKLRNARAAIVCGLVVALAGILQVGATEAVRESFELTVPVPPAPATIEGSARLVYEMHITNFSRDTLELAQVEIIDADNGATIDRFAGEALSSRLGRSDSMPHDGDIGVVASGARVIFYVETASDAKVLPESLVHRVVYQVAGAGSATPFEVSGGRATVRQDLPPPLGPPLRGGPWAAIYGPEWQRGHRRVLYTANGRATIPGRFAIDWFRVDEEGRMERAAGTRFEDALGYGEEVLAVADGVVAAARDGYPEVTPGEPAPAKQALVDAAGNYVVLRLSDGSFVFYEHLAPGTVRVSAGERVRRGQTIAALGSSGSSRRPHLHFHVADDASPLGGEGLPFVLERFRLLGRYEAIEDLGVAPWSPLDESFEPERLNELPPSNYVLDFGESVE